MAMTVREIKEWLDGLEDGRLVGVDDGGLCLEVVGNPETYCEIGGIPDGDDDESEDVEEPDARPSPRNLAACYRLASQQVKKAEKIMNRTHEGVPIYLELPEGSEPLTVCWLYDVNLREIGTVTPAQAIKL